MKKLLTIDDLIIALVAAVGYAFTFEIPKVFGYTEEQRTIICIVIGITLDVLEYKIVFSKTVQKTPALRFVTLITFLIVFLVAQDFAKNILGMPMLDYVIEQYGYVIIPPLLVFAFNIARRQYRIKKIRNRYGDGSKGFVFDDALKKIYIEELNQQNQPIHGAFDTDCAVKTKTGIFVGEKEKNTLYFLGIPYAKPPVGERRWKAPEPLPESEEVFEAKHLGASAIQVDYENSPLRHHRQSEDCLTLNICVRVKKTKRKKPVIVIFHYGDFSYGSSADPLMHGEHFSKIYPNTVGVTFNHRLGIFGFIDFSEIPGGEAYPDTLNLGLLDQIAALRWIKENISAFGGDPERITVVGFESGAISLCLLAASAQAKGLFQKAFIFYGTPLLTYDTPEQARDLAKKLLQETATTTMEELMRLPTERLKEASQKLTMNFSGPIRDGKLIPADVYAAYQAGAASNVEFIIGIPSNERQIYKSFVGYEEYEDFMSKLLNNILDYLDGIHPAVANAVRDYVDEQAEQAKQMSALEVKAKVYDQFCALSIYHCAKILAASGSKVHLLYWNAKPLIENLGSGTVDVLATFLGNRETIQMFGNVLNKDITDTIQNLFRKFESGDEMRLFNNEIKGIKAIDWKEFPQALIVSEKGFQCATIEDKLTEVKCLLELLE